MAGKTNQFWYLYKDIGLVCRLIDGELYVADRYCDDFEEDKILVTEQNFEEEHIAPDDEEPVEPYGRRCRR